MSRPPKPPLDTLLPLPHIRNNLTLTSGSELTRVVCSLTPLCCSRGPIKDLPEFLVWPLITFYWLRRPRILLGNNVITLINTFFNVSFPKWPIYTKTALIWVVILSPEWFQLSPNWYSGLLPNLSSTLIQSQLIKGRIWLHLSSYKGFEGSYCHGTKSKFQLLWHSRAFTVCPLSFQAPFFLFMSCILFLCIYRSLYLEHSSGLHCQWKLRDRGDCTRKTAFPSVFFFKAFPFPIFLFFPDKEKGENIENNVHINHLEI